MRRLFPLLLLASLSPAMAEDQPPPNLAASEQANEQASGQGTQGGVARLFLSHQLYALGTAAKDPLTVLNAARLAASVALAETPRAHETSVNAAETLPLHMHSPDQMFDTAAMLSAQDDGLLDMVDASRREAGFIPNVTVISTESTLAAAQTDIWHQSFFGESLAEIAILGAAANTFDLRVTDENSNPICLGAGADTAQYCSFYPAENGAFQIHVTNRGTAAIPYLLVTN